MTDLTFSLSLLLMAGVGNRESIGRTMKDQGIVLRHLGSSMTLFNVMFGRTLWVGLGHG